MADPIRILFVGQSDTDVPLLRQELQTIGYQPYVKRVASGRGMRSALAADEWDAVLSDILLKRFSAEAALKIMTEVGPEIPFILLCDSADAPTVASLLKAGANGFVQKREMTWLLPTLERGLREARIRRQRTKALDDLRQAKSKAEKTEALLKDALESIDDPFALFDQKGRLVTFNGAWEQLYRESADLLVPGIKFEELLRSRAEHGLTRGLTGAIEAWVRERMSKFWRREGPVEHVFPGGTWWRFSEHRTAQGGVAQIATDITSLKVHEQELRESEERFRKVFESTAIGSVIVGCNGRFRLVNPAFEEMLGYSEDELLSMTLLDVTHPDDREAAKRWAKRMSVGETDHVQMEKRCIRKDGRATWVSVTTSVVRNAQGRPDYMITQILDITERKQAEEALRESEERFRDLVEASSDWMWETDADDRFTYISERLFEVLKLGPKDVLRRTSEEIAARSGLPADWAGKQEDFMARRPFRDTQCSWRDRRGHLRALRLSGRPRRDDDGSFLGYRGTGSDVTAEVQAKERETLIQQRFLQAIETVPVAFALFDPEDRLVVSNGQYRALASEKIRKHLKPGLHFEDLLRREIAAGAIPEAREDPEGWLNERLERHRNPTDGFEIRRSEGWIAVHEHRTSEGGTLIVCHDITERKRTEESLRRLSTAVEQSPAAIVITDPRGRIEYANPTYAQKTGYGLDEAVGQIPAFLNCEVTDPTPHKRVWKAVQGGREWRGELRNRRKNGELYWSSVALSPIRGDGGRVLNFLAIAEDTTDKRLVDDQLRHAQKLEAVGTLAGGVAHDFNNILTGILGHCQIAIEKLPDDSNLRFNLDQIMGASDRARDLVQQLLAFSRRKEAVLEPVNMHTVVDEAMKLVHASTPSTIRLRWHAPPEAGAAMADATQIHQVLLNLCSNATDAIGTDTGTIDVSVDSVKYSNGVAVSGYDLPPGQYVRLRVQDTGCGMDNYTLSRVFDPFFTTKAVGSGTGLGLAAVHGIVQDHGGGLQVESEPDKGSTFTILLPAAHSSEEPAAPKDKTSFAGTERILLVDDERMVVQSMGGYLEHFGYRIEALTSANAALALFKSMPDEFDLVVTDQIMPGMTGEDLAQRLTEIRSDIPIILCTGYAPPVSEKATQAVGFREIVHKPVEPSELGRVIRQTLDAVA